MMGMLKGLGLLGVGVLLIAGCNRDEGGASTAKKVESNVKAIDKSAGWEKRLFPFKKGNTWVYSLESTRVRNSRRAEAKADITYQVTAVNGDRATIEVRDQNKKLIDRQVWLSNDKGLYQVSISTKDVAYNPAQPVAIFPVTAGKSFRWTGRGVLPTGEIGTQTIETTPQPPIIVDTLAGQFEAIPFETSYTMKGGANGSGDSTTFFAPGVGIVRYRQTNKSDLETGSLVLKLKEKNF